MPYYISDENPDCSGWAVEKSDGEVMGCHTTKQAAIDQMVALSLAEDMEPGGERAAPDALSEGDFVRWRSSGGNAQGRIEHVMTEGVLGVPGSSFSINASPEDPAALIRIYERYEDGWRETETLVGHKFSTLTKIDPLPAPSDGEDRQVSLSLPAYIKEAAAQGIEYYEQGLGGSGLVQRTVREARAMARGEISENKVIRVSAWAARHEPDLRAQGAKPGEDGYPTPGAVAHLLWGIPTGGRYSDARAWFDRKAEQIREEDNRMEKTPVEPRSKGSKIEFRSLEGEIRAEGDGNTFVGYAAVFNSPSQPLPFTERIAPGAFRKSLRSRSMDVRLYVNHNSDMVLASKKSGTLRLEEDERGLRVEADLPNTTAGNDLRELLRTGVVSKMSFGFTVPKGGDKWSDDGMERTLTGINLHEVSVVTGFPAYEATMAAVRSLGRLSERTGLAIDDLSAAIDALADGETLDEAKAGVLMDAIKASLPEPEPQQVNLISLKSKQTELLAKKPL